MISRDCGLWCTHRWAEILLRKLTNCLEKPRNTEDDLTTEKLLFYHVKLVSVYSYLSQTSGKSGTTSSPRRGPHIRLVFAKVSDRF